MNLRVALSEADLEELAEAVAERLANRPLSGEQDAPWPQWMSLSTAATYLDMSEERVRKLLARGALPFHQEAPGCRIFLQRSDLDEAMVHWRRR